MVKSTHLAPYLSGNLNDPVAVNRSQHLYLAATSKFKQQLSLPLTVNLSLTSHWAPAVKTYPLLSFVALRPKLNLSLL